MKTQKYIHTTTATTTKQTNTHTQKMFVNKWSICIHLYMKRTCGWYCSIFARFCEGGILQNSRVHEAAKTEGHKHGHKNAIIIVHATKQQILSGRYLAPNMVDFRGMHCAEFATTHKKKHVCMLARFYAQTCLHFRAHTKKDRNRWSGAENFCYRNIPLTLIYSPVDRVLKEPSRMEHHTDISTTALHIYITYVHIIVEFSDTARARFVLDGACKTALRQKRAACA